MGEECLERIVSENAMDGWVINGVLSEYFTRAMKSCGREPVPVIFIIWTNRERTGWPMSAVTTRSRAGWQQG